MGPPVEAPDHGSDNHLFLSLHKSTPDAYATWGTWKAQSGVYPWSIPRESVFRQVRKPHPRGEPVLLIQPGDGSRSLKHLRQPIQPHHLQAHPPAGLQEQHRSLRRRALGRVGLSWTFLSRLASLTLTSPTAPGCPAAGRRCSPTLVRCPGPPGSRTRRRAPHRSRRR
jgi:hypothetical protein